PDAGDAEQPLEGRPLLDRGEAVQGELVLAQVKVRVEVDLLARLGLRHRLCGRVDVQADAADPDDEVVLTAALDWAADRRDHCGMGTTEGGRRTMVAPSSIVHRPSCRVTA